MTLQLSTAVRPTRRGPGRGRPIDETGNRYGRWQVLGRAESTDGAALWICRCDCGRESVVRGWMLRKGTSKSCGCLRVELFTKMASLPVGESALNSVIVNMKGNARRRGYGWNLSREFVREMIAQDCQYCGSKPLQLSKARNGNLRYNGLDRVDNSRGYEVDNVVPCCSICNTAKSNMSKADFFAWVTSVYNRSKSE